MVEEEIIIVAPEWTGSLPEEQPVIEELEPEPEPEEFSEGSFAKLKGKISKVFSWEVLKVGVIVVGIGAGVAYCSGGDERLDDDDDDTPIKLDDPLPGRVSIGKLSEPSKPSQATHFTATSQALVTASALPTPQPMPADLQAALDALEVKVAAQEELEEQLGKYKWQAGVFTSELQAFFDDARAHPISTAEHEQRHQKILDKGTRKLRQLDNAAVVVSCNGRDFASCSYDSAKQLRAGDSVAFITDNAKCYVNTKTSQDLPLGTFVQQLQGLSLCR